ncbi:hypothetical protein SH611_18570 [Geminicoccaceae bacterium 1502E]|nr:hypothetical protein [Geminicoccaceae bacterium 1502E]
MSMKPVSGRVELELDFPEKLFMGSFSQASAFEAVSDGEGVTLRLRRLRGERRVVSLELHWYVFADMLEQLAQGLAQGALPEDPRRRRAQAAAAALAVALEPRS